MKRRHVWPGTAPSSLSTQAEGHHCLHESPAFFRNIIGADTPSGKASTVEIEDVIAVAIKDLTADDWARLPEDLVECLDRYLY